MSPQAFRAHLERLAASQGDFARFLAIDDRTVRRWAEDGGAGPPRSVALLLALLETYGLGLAEAAAILERDRG